MSTLGIVEATIFTVHKYYNDLDLQKERIFADVHFTLFFVAIINALMSCIIYVLASKLAERRWVTMETLDIDHYVAFRKQFDQVQEKIDFLDNKKTNATGNNNDSSSNSTSYTTGESTRNGSNSNSNSNNNSKQRAPAKSKRSPLSMTHSERGNDFFRDNDDSYDPESGQQHSELHSATKSNLSSQNMKKRMNSSDSNNNSSQDNGNTNFVSFLGTVLKKDELPFGQHNLIRGILEKKHAELLIRLRFHELRVHFIEKHHLKYNFRVSDYLRLAMNDVFKDFVHISTRTWIGKTFSIFFLYSFIIPNCMSLSTNFNWCFNNQLSW